MFGTYCRLRVHVSATPREVIAAAALKLTPAARQGRTHRDARHAFYRTMLEHHARAAALVVTWRL